MRLVLLLAAAACGPVTTAPVDKAPFSSALVTTERGPRGGHLVFLAEDGRTMADLTETEIAEVIDSQASWSPDGNWVVFASSRNRENVGETSLWLVRGQARTTPVRLTTERSIDRGPVWTPDQSAIVFVSNARGKRFAVWKLPMAKDARGWPVIGGKGVQLTFGDRDALSPNVSPDGKTVVYMQHDRDTQRSELWSVSIDGKEPRKLTDGPADLTPCYSPDGKHIAFAAPVVGRGDTDLFIVDADGSNRRRVIDAPLADETGPEFASDGRHLFATSVYRAAEDSSAVLSSVVVVDLQGKPRILRALHDPAVVESRIGSAIGPKPLDAAALATNAPYADALRRALAMEPLVALPLMPTEFFRNQPG